MSLEQMDTPCTYCLQLSCQLSRSVAAGQLFLFRERAVDFVTWKLSAFLLIMIRSSCQAHKSCRAILCGGSKPYASIGGMLVRFFFVDSSALQIPRPGVSGIEDSGERDGMLGVGYFPLDCVMGVCWRVPVHVRHASACC